MSAAWRKTYGCAAHIGDNCGRADKQARVTSKGQGLKFSDDVMIGEKRFPYVQIRGDFSLAVY